jgi:hypothetical protein
LYVSSRRAQRRQVAWAPLAVTVVMLIALLGFLVADEAGDALARFFGIQGSSIERLDPPPGGVVPTPLPAPEDIEFLARKSTIESAARSLGFSPPLPSGSGDPVAIFEIDAFGNPVVILQYPAYDVWVARPAQALVFAKGLPAGTTLRDTSVNGYPARWISDGYHLLTFRDVMGREAAGLRRTVARNTLVWATDGAFYRIETDLPFEATLDIARTLP